MRNFHFAIWIFTAGKIRGPIPFVPAYTKPETPEEEYYDPALNYDPLMDQVRAIKYTCTLITFSSLSYFKFLHK